MLGSGKGSLQFNEFKQLPATEVHSLGAARCEPHSPVSCSGACLGRRPQAPCVSAPVNAQRMEPEWQVGRAVSAQPGAARKWLEVGIWISGRGALLSPWHGPLPPPFLSREGQVVAVILQLALATERFANSSGMQIPPAFLARRMPLDPLSLAQAVSQPGFLPRTRVGDNRRR